MNKPVARRKAGDNEVVSAKQHRSPLEEEITPELIDALREGDLRAFEMLYSEYQQPVMKFLTPILCSAADAEEVTQDMFTELWTNRARWPWKMNRCVHGVGGLRTQRSL